MKLSVDVKANSRIEGVERIDENKFVVRVNTPPENGKANYRVCELLAEFLNLPKSRLRVLRGHKSKKKIVVIA